MAEKAKGTSKNPKPTMQNPEGKSRRILQGFLAVMLALVIVAMVFCGVFYIILKNNVYGLGEIFRPVFQDSPILRLALPPLHGKLIRMRLRILPIQKPGRNIMNTDRRWPISPLNRMRPRSSASTKATRVFWKKTRPYWKPMRSY